MKEFENNYKIIEINTQNESIEKLKYFYDNIYVKCFKDPNEIESFENLIKYLKIAKTANEYFYHIILVENDKKNIIAGGIFDYFKISNSAFVEFVAVDPDAQSSGIGQFLFDNIFAILIDDEKKCNKKLPYIFCEIDSPEYSPLKIKKYLYFWNKNGFKKIDANYYQPQLSENQKTVNGLWIVAKSLNNNENFVEKEYFLSAIKDYMQFAMSIDEPENNAEFLKMEYETKNKNKLNLIKIIDK